VSCRKKTGFVSKGALAPVADRGPLISVRDVERDYHGLRPLRLRRFELHEGQTVAILGMDRAAAEAFVNLVSGATLPETGMVETLGRVTTSVTSNDDWVRLLDDIGILSERSVVLGEMTAAQNLAMPFSLEVFDMAADLRDRVEGIAVEVGLHPDRLNIPVAGLSMLDRARLRLARAVAASPRLLLAEHPNALVEESMVGAFGEDLDRVIAGRRLAAVVLTADRTFARQVAQSLLVHHPATGDLKPAPLWRRWLS